MNDSAIRSQVIAIIRSIAPELDADALRADQSLRRQVDLDSIDWLNVIQAIHEQMRVDIPEADYAKLGSLNDMIAYLTAKMDARG